MSLRDYQHEDMLKVGECFRRGERRLLGVWPTGAGKTQALSHLNKYVDIVGREVVLVNREELVWQTAEKLRRYNPLISIGIEKAEYRHDVNDDIIVACVQSISSVKKNSDGSPDFNKRLSTINPETVGSVTCDEAHHALSDSFRNIFRWLRVYQAEAEYNDPEKLLLCLTATPNRMDNKGLEEICSTVAFSRDIRWGIQAGWLCDIKAYRVNTEVDISSVKMLGGDFNQKQLESTVNTEKRNQIVVDKYLELTPGKKAIAFTSSVEHSKALTEKFNQSGVSSFALDSTTPGDIRRQVIQEDFKSGKYKILTSVGVLCEGFDEPSVEVGLMVRPTKSGLLYRQAVGRVLRPSPAPEEIAAMAANGLVPDWIKPEAIIIDFVDVSSRHSLITAPTLFGFNANLDLAGKKAVETLLEVEEKLKKLPPNKAALVSLDAHDDLLKLYAFAEKVDLLTAPTTPESVKKFSELSWIEIGSGLQLGLPENTFAVRPNTLGKFDTYKITKGLQQYLNSYNTLEAAVSNVEAAIPQDQYQFAKNTASWKKDAPTESQIALLATIDKAGRGRFAKREDFMAYLRTNLTKGAASTMISSILAKRG